MKAIFIIYCVTVVISLINECIAITIRKIEKRNTKFKMNKISKIIIIIRRITIALFPTLNIALLILICFDKITNSL